MKAAKRPNSYNERNRAYTDRAVVLRTYPFGEAHRVVVLLTKEHGKVRAVAKGARKTSSRFAALLEPCSHVEVALYRSKSELQTVTQVASVETFPAIRTDFERLTRAMAMVEAADYFSLDSEPNEGMYQMLVGALGVVAEENPVLTLGAFFMRLLCHEGFSPQIDTCTSCLSQENLVAFDVNSGGTRCGSCRQGFPVEPNHLRVLALLIQGRVSAALSLPETQVMYQINEIATALVQHHTERQIKALNIGGI